MIAKKKPGAHKKSETTSKKTSASERIRELASKKGVTIPLIYYIK